MSRCKQTKSHCSIIGCNLSKEHKLPLYKTQNGEPNYIVDPTYLYKTLEKDIQILYSWLVGWYMYCVTTRLHDIKKLTSVSPEYTMKVLPLPFHYTLGSYLHLFVVIHFTKSKLIARSVPVPKLPEKMYYSHF